MIAKIEIEKQQKQNIVIASGAVRQSDWMKVKILDSSIFNWFWKK